MTKEEILAAGYVQIRVKRAGIWQKLTFRVEKTVSPVGLIPYLMVDRFVDMPELLRVAEETGLPVKAKNGKVFPRGKTEHDFVGL